MSEIETRKYLTQEADCTSLCNVMLYMEKMIIEGVKLKLDVIIIISNIGTTDWVLFIM
jgi:hypothetical protein